MASGRMAARDITQAATDTQVYQVPSNKTASFSIMIVNRSALVVNVRIALTASTTIQAGEYIAYDVPLYPNEVYERTGLVLEASKYVYVRSSGTSVNAVICGYEE
jgi:hypothetical protein